MNHGTGAALAFADSGAVGWTGGTLDLTDRFVSGSSLRFGTRDRGKLPEISSSGGNMLFTFKRDQKSIGGTSVLRIDTSPDLLDWTNGYMVPDGAASSNPGVTVVKGIPAGFDTVTLSLPLSDAKKFARLNATP